MCTNCEKITVNLHIYIKYLNIKCNPLTKQTHNTVHIFHSPIENMLEPKCKYNFNFVSVNTGLKFVGFSLRTNVLEGTRVARTGISHANIISQPHHSINTLNLNSLEISEKTFPSKYLTLITYT